MNRQERRRQKKLQKNRNGAALDEHSQEILKQGLAAHQSGDLAEALHAYQHVLHHVPDNPDALALAGIVSCQMGEMEDGTALLQSSVAIRPDNLDAQFNLGHALETTGRYEEAAKAYKKVIQIEPGAVDAYFNLGKVFFELEQPENAARHLRKAIELHPEHADAHGNLGNVLKDIGDLDAAEASIRKGLELKGGDGVMLSNLGNILKEQNRLEEAAETHRRALALLPDYAEGHGNYGNTLSQQGRLDEAIEQFERALALNPDLIESRSNYTLALLKSGRLKDGWREYATRWQWKGFDHPLRPFTQPAWDGGPLEGKTILVWGEQGIGDELMFANMFPDLLERAQEVLVECDPRLVEMFERSFPGIKVYPRRSPPHPDLATNKTIDYQMSAGDLCQYLRPDIESFPKHAGYIETDPDAVSRLREKYRALGNGAFVVGISWRSGNKHVGEKRSAGLELWAPILSCPDCFFVNLQYGKVKPFLEAFESETGIHVHCDDEVDPLENMDLFNAQIAATDLVISIDNSTVHASGAIGAPVWTLLSAAPDWRWGQDAERSYWYPSMSLIRQDKLGSWESVFEKAGTALDARTRNSLVGAV